MALPDRKAYPTQRQPLRQYLGDLLKEATAPEISGEIRAIIVPDANLLNGAKAAAEIYKVLAARHYENVMLIAPSHAGNFQRLTICSLDTYHTPLGDLVVNDKVRNELCDEDDDIFLDDEGHFQPDGIDVQLPFLQMVLPAFDIVPIVMGDESPALCKELGNAVGEVMYNRPTLVVASANILHATDAALAQFKTHFEAGDVPRLTALLNGDALEMTGKGAVLTALIAALHRRADHLEVLHLAPPDDGEPGYLSAVMSRG